MNFNTKDAKGILVGVAVIIVIAALATTLVSGALMLAPQVDVFPQETEYNYEIKAQQVFDGDRVGDSDVTEFEDLSDDERALLYDAFKKTDHFMGSAESVELSKDRRFDTFTDWRTVESNGVLLLVAINEEQSTAPDNDKFVWYHHAIALSWFIVLIGLFVLMVAPPP